MFYTVLYIASYREKPNVENVNFIYKVYEKTYYSNIDAKDYK